MACSTVGLVGSTGSRKTSTADIILGLLEPQKGELKVDGKIINNQNRRSGKSPWDMFHNLFLADDTILLILVSDMMRMILIKTQL